MPAGLTAADPIILMFFDDFQERASDARLGSR
jgi:hypothetical protein